jgi:hypothetical protein
MHFTHVPGTARTVCAIQHEPSPEISVLYQEEAGACLNAKIGPTCLMPRQHPVAPAPGKSVERYVFGALNARTGRIIHGIAG